LDHKVEVATLDVAALDLEHEMHTRMNVHVQPATGRPDADAVVLMTCGATTIPRKPRPRRRLNTDDECGVANALLAVKSQTSPVARHRQPSPPVPSDTMAALLPPFVLKPQSARPARTPRRGLAGLKTTMLGVAKSTEAKSARSSSPRRLTRSRPDELRSPPAQHERQAEGGGKPQGELVKTSARKLGLSSAHRVKPQKLRIQC